MKGKKLEDNGKVTFQLNINQSQVNVKFSDTESSHNIKDKIINILSHVYENQMVK